MPKFNATELSLYNGISQQSPELRLPSQVEDANNALLTVARGLERRPPAIAFYTKDAEEWSDNTLVQEIPLDAELSYTFIMDESRSLVIDTKGIEYPIFYEGTTATYINTPKDGLFNPRVDLKLTTILDSTFIVNKNVTCSMGATVEPSDINNHAYLWVKNGVQQVTRTVTKDGTSATHPKNISNDTKLITQYFESNLAATKLSDSVLYWSSLTDIELSATDSYGDTTMVVSQTSGTQEKDLPTRAVDGHIFTIVSDQLEDDDYYLKWNEDKKVFSEVPAPAGLHTIDQTTMPLRMLRKLDDAGGTKTGTPFAIYFQVDFLEFTSRLSGDDKSSPEPSFIGKTISDIFYFKNRLGLVAGDGVILSATDDLLRYWPRTIKEVLDDDPIDVTISSNKNITLSHATVFPETMMLIGNGEQYRLGSGTKPFTHANVQLEPTTSYYADPKVSPVSTGSSIYFLAPMSNFTSLREYSVQADTLIADAEDVSSHVSRHIDNDIIQMISDTNLDYIFLLPSNAEKDSRYKIHVYKYFWQGNAKAQSAWSTWDVWFKPLGGYTFNGHLYLFGMERVDGLLQVVFVSMNLRGKTIDELDDFDNTYKNTLPNMDKQRRGIDDVVQRNGNNLYLGGEVSSYEQLFVAGHTPVMVDRITGETFRYVPFFTDGDEYVFTTDIAVLLNGFILGLYPLGGVPVLPIEPAQERVSWDQTDISWDSTEVTFDTILKLL